jgi:hypothetical protein
MKPLDIRCPSCGAEPGKPCRTHASAELISLKKRGKRPADLQKREASLSRCDPHAARIERASAA